MSYDICPYCDGSGERDWLSGASCYYCHGKGVIEDQDPEEFFDEDWEREMDQLWSDEAKKELG